MSRILQRLSLMPVQITLALVILVLAAVIRVRGAMNGLWLDEIWSLELVKNLSSPFDVFTKLHHENNHYLNSLLMYFVGQHGNWVGYRMPSLFLGSASVVFAGLIGRRWGTAGAVFAMILTSCSYFMVLYSSEARGYAAVVFCSFLCFYLLERFLDTRRWPFAVLFSVSAVLGMLSHLLFLNCLLATLPWVVHQFVNTRAGWKPAIIALLQLYVLPAAFIATIYFVDVHHMQIGGGTPTKLFTCYASSLGWTFGLPHGEADSMATVLCGGVILAGAGWLCRRELREAGWFFAGVILIFPIALALIRHSRVIYVRHFILGMAFALILLSAVLATLFRRGGASRIICFVLLAGFLAANCWQTLALFKYGRGQYAEAERYLAEHSQKMPVTIAAIGIEQDFRTPFVLHFYAPEALSNTPAVFYTRNHLPADGTEWLIADAESFHDLSPPPARFTDSAERTYELVKVFPTAQLSGLRWALYHRQIE